jgi:hypothetical protein
MIGNFDKQGEQLGNAERNSIKLFGLNDKTITVKSFKIPNPVNQIAYKYFRKSKARRSYEYARKLFSLGIKTPRPVAFFEFTSQSVFTKSFYFSEYLKADLTFRNLVQDPDYPDHENILRAFTRFTYKLHEKQVEFKDHSPGNTLICKEDGKYEFYLVDLNRMEFKDLTFQERMKNFSRLTPKKEMVRVMSDEYSKFIDHSFEEVFQAMWFFTKDFQEKFHRKKRIKKKLKFWEE